MASTPNILGLGEALFDLFPTGAILGGAPLNVAVHAHQLLRASRGLGVVVSRVGRDEYGGRIVSELKGRAMPALLVQIDPTRPTGTVRVSLDAKGQPTFEIMRGVAWDHLAMTRELHDAAAECDAVCFGSLAQRSEDSRKTIYETLALAERAIRMFDVNLRQRFYDARILQGSCERSNALKLNDQELPIVSSLLTPGVAEARPGDRAAQDSAVEALIKKFPGLTLVALTRGEKGTVLYAEGRRYESEPVSYPMAAGADAVGAGDACTAGLLVGMVKKFSWERTLALANHAGAYVASQRGATPALPEAVLRLASA